MPSDEAIADFRLACLSRAIDGREQTLQKQSKVYFEISGAGHEASGSGSPARCGPATTGSSPTTATRRWSSDSACRPYDMLLQAVGSAADPASGGRQMPSHWGPPVGTS